jgi:hypothetical protein
VQQVAVRGVDLEAVEAEAGGAARGGREVGADLLHPVGVEGERRLFSARMGKRRGRDRAPAARLAQRNLRAALPWNLTRCLAAGMCELHADPDRRVGAHGAEDVRQRRFVGVAVETEVGVRDPSLGRDRGRLDDHQARARQRQVAQVDQVPVARRALARGVLAHRRDDDPVGERESADLQRLEELGHGRRAARGGRGGYGGRRLAFARQPTPCSGGSRIYIETSFGILK